MAIEIKTIPILYKEDAKKFIEKADKAYLNKGTIDFSKQIKSANNILEKAKMK